MELARSGAAVKAAKPLPANVFSVFRPPLRPSPATVPDAASSLQEECRFRGPRRGLSRALAAVIGAPPLLPSPLLAQHLGDLGLEALFGLAVAGIVGGMAAAGIGDLLL